MIVIDLDENLKKYKVGDLIEFKLHGDPQDIKLKIY
jgi:hypothetical protein